MAATKINVSVASIMTREPVCAEPSMSIRQFALLLEQNEVSGAPVVDAQGRVIGVASKSDLIRRCSEGTRDLPPGYLFEVISDQGGDEEGVIPEPLICVQDFMSEDVETARPETPISQVAKQMYDRRIHRVIIVDEEHMPVGIVTSLDVLGAFPTDRGA